MSGQRADAGLKKKRETQRERVAKAINLSFREEGYDPESDPPSVWEEFLRAAEQAIAAYPEPYIKKERGRPKLPTDDCVLCATRREFVALVEFIERTGDPFEHDDDMLATVNALASALREQGVVR